MSLQRLFYRFKILMEAFAKVLIEVFCFLFEIGIIFLLGYEFNSVEFVEEFFCGLVKMFLYGYFWDEVEGVYEIVLFHVFHCDNSSMIPLCNKYRCLICEKYTLSWPLNSYQTSCKYSANPVECTNTFHFGLPANFSAYAYYQCQCTRGNRTKLWFSSGCNTFGMI